MSFPVTPQCHLSNNVLVFQLILRPLSASLCFLWSINHQPCGRCAQPISISLCDVFSHCLYGQNCVVCGCCVEQDECSSKLVRQLETMSSCSDPLRKLPWRPQACLPPRCPSGKQFASRADDPRIAFSPVKPHQ